MSSTSFTAIDPRHSASVSASAGTGKTWLLVGRLIRLLLEGAEPAGILAITFTRKAAAEMQTRLASRLLTLAESDGATLKAELEQIGAPSDSQTLSKARQLYEQLLRNPYPIQSATFHAFCQDILRRFPLEAGVAPGFELAESTSELQVEAWDTLCAEASSKPDGMLAEAMETLMEACGGLSNTQSALHTFLQHRSDWWAYTEDQTEPLPFAMERLQQQLRVDSESNPLELFYTETSQGSIRDYAQLIARHATKTTERDAATLFRIVETAPMDAESFAELCGVFLTKTHELRVIKDSKPRVKALGDDGEARYRELHEQLGQKLQQVLERLAAQQTLRRTQAWYVAGERLLHHYQRLKAEQRVLDFADLEWKAYRLLNHGDNAHWIQYKLDQRIDHLLVDEFQDTNPTQWRMILPLLEELAAAENRRGRSVFLVGDNKQSIYRFRRADPELFSTAQAWVETQLQAVSQPLNTSWRSSPAIMDFVNLIFGSGPLHENLKSFSPHATHHQNLWGRVELLPLIKVEEDEEEETAPITPDGLRNPLKQPRLIKADQRHVHEGQLIARTVRELMAAETPIGQEAAARPLRYGDIMILVRQRTHVAQLEQALREADIPYSSANRGTLLDSLEVQDMKALLECLVMPFNNLALAQVLRSPLFACTEEHLALLAQQGKAQWLDALSAIVPNQEKTQPLRRAGELLAHWHALASRIPVHDLLDNIFNEGDVLRRYEAAYPPHLRHRAEANLTRFLELALEIDSGRYPSLGHFVARLQTLQQRDEDTPDEGTPTQVSDRVRIMTIHASKGLEAPVVFLADSATEKASKTSGQAIVHWPTTDSQPQTFLLAGKKAEQDGYTQGILEQHAKAEAREDANLLYVAVTRARQMLFISGCHPTRGEQLGWYGTMARQCAQLHETNALTDILETGWQEEAGHPPSITAKPQIVASAIEVEPALSQPLPKPPRELFIAPSRQQDSRGISDKGEDEDGRLRGMVIHRMLQLLCEGVVDIPVKVGNEFSLPAENPDLGAWYQEALGVFQAPQLAHLFRDDKVEKAFNEVPLQYQLDGEKVYGILDRLTVTSEAVWLMDYKTHRVSSPTQIDAIREQYRSQINYYRQGVQRLWPDKTIHCGLILTHTTTWIEM